MVKTSRVKIVRIIEKLTPIFIGFVILSTLAVFINSYLNFKKVQEEEYLNYQRNVLIDDYNQLSTKFESNKLELLLLTIADSTSLYEGYMEDLNSFELLNYELYGISKSILESSERIHWLADEVVQTDRKRVINHQVYSDLIYSLSNYANVIERDRDIKSCYSGINLEGKDSSIRESIEVCNSNLNNMLESIKDENEDIVDYWNSYKEYWNLVYSIHNSPKLDSIPKLREGLSTTHNKVSNSEKSYIEYLDHFYKRSYIERLLEY